MTVKFFAWLALCLPFIIATVFAQEPVPSTFFGMHAHNGVLRKQPWPSASFGTIRLWDTGTRWIDLEPQPGHYNWNELDRWLDAAEAHHLEVLFTFGGIPAWATGDINDPKCKAPGKKLIVPGSCHPPADLREDGSGTDQTWKEFVTALVQHAHGRIKYWEVWNEPHNLFFWHGTMPQIVRMTQDLRTIAKASDPNALIISPGTGWENNHPDNRKPDWNPLYWTEDYLAAGGSKYIDAVGIHGYLRGECPSGYYDSTQIPVRTDNVRKVMKKNGAGDLPIWSTEGSWGPASKRCTSDPDMQTAFVGQYYIQGWASGVKRMYWYAWNDGDTGMLWNKETERLQPAGKAYDIVYHWMVGATLTGCDTDKKQTTCNFTRDTSQYLAIWDGAQTCSSGNCTTHPVKVDAKFVDYLDLDGGKIKIENGTVPVGLKPIWLEASSGGAQPKGEKH